MTELRGVYSAKIVIQVGGKSRRVTRLEALLLRLWEQGMKGNVRATQAAIANAKVLGVFDETETDESSLTDCLSKETIRQLSYDALQELIEIERARMKKALK
jgi:hypothetical protein